MSSPERTSNRTNSSNTHYSNTNYSNANSSNANSSSANSSNSNSSVGATPIPSLGQLNRREDHDGSGDAMDLGDMSSGSVPAQSTMPQVRPQAPAPAANPPQTLMAILKEPRGSVYPVTARDPAAFAEALTIAANQHECVEIHMAAGLEDSVVRILSSAQTWTRARILINQELRQDFLLQLELALSAAGQCKTVSLDVDMLQSTFPSLPRGPAIQFDSLFLAGGKGSADSCLPFLRQPNPELELFAWSGLSETSAVVEALSQGSHQLIHMAMSQPPDNVPGLLGMLRCKTSLSTLILKYVQPDLRLADILAAAPSLGRLVLQRACFSRDSLQGSAAALAQSGLTFLDLSIIEFKDMVNPDDELALGLSRAKFLEHLHLHAFSGSVNDISLLEAFARNPAARKLSIRSAVSQPGFLDLMNRLNQDRKRDGMVPLEFRYNT